MLQSTYKQPTRLALDALRSVPPAERAAVFKAAQALESADRFRTSNVRLCHVTSAIAARIFPAPLVVTV